MRWLGSRRGFTLLEVMVALAILVAALVVLVEAQATSAMMTREAERYVIATALAQEKLTEVRLMLEQDGFQEEDVYESGEFDDFGDQVLDIEFQDLADYHWEWLVAPIDEEQLSGVIESVDSFLATDESEDDVADEASAVGSFTDLSSLGISNETIGLMLAQYVREIRVRVYWGDNSELAEEEGQEVIITVHASNPSGNMVGGVDMSGATNLSGGAGADRAGRGGAGSDNARGAPRGRGGPGASGGTGSTGSTGGGASGAVRGRGR